MEPGPNLDPLNLQKMPLKNLVQSWLERSSSKNAGKKALRLFCFFHKLLGFKSAILFKMLKKKHFAPFSTANYFWIDFSKILNNLLFHAANQVYWTSVEIESIDLEYKSELMVKLSWNFDFAPKIAKKATKKYHKYLRKSN